MTQPSYVYGITENNMEVDSDVNEDRNREEQLDDSFEAWYENIGDQVKRKMDLTNVAKTNAFDSAVELEGDPS